eukprot:TRINITY_DN2648_c0_g1_i1.p1 TRINITY_DN2648_c0_g1~~TRINITY_DN2648_c0_g1_i1.p1  ORF type:complete len:443 (+),score=111.80 TRINITY_DN2648_c0_g1_i1:248-1576(+)
MTDSGSAPGGFKVIFISLLLDLLAFTLILPLFPSLLEYYRSNGDEFYALLDNQVRLLGEKLGAPPEFNSVLFGGVLGSLFSFLQFISSPIMGSLSDHYGRRPLLLISTLGIAASYVVWMAAGSFKIFILARIVGGLFKGNISLSTAVVTDMSNNKNRAKGMALIGIAFSLGFILGPCIGAGFSAWARGRTGAWYVYPAACALLFALGDFFYLLLFFKETLGKREEDLRKAIKQSFTYINPLFLFRFESLEGSLSPLELSSLRSYGLVNFIYLFLYSGLEFTLTFLTHIRFNFNSMDQGKMFFFVGAVMAAIQGGYVRRRIPPGKEKANILRGLLLIVPSFAIVGLSRSVPVLYLGLGLYSVSTALVVPCLATLVSQFGEVHQKGVVLGVYRSLGALGRALGPLSASVLYWTVGPELCYCLGGLGLLIPYVILKRIPPKKKEA